MVKYDLELAGSIEFDSKAKLDDVLDFLDKWLKKRDETLWASITRTDEIELEGEKHDSTMRLEKKLGKKE